MVTRGKKSDIMETELIKEELAPRILEWQISTVIKVKVETNNVKTFTLALPNWTAHKAGQHYDVRLTAPDGYQAQRSYSIASNPEQKGQIDLTVERLEDGEVSTYLHDVLIVGDQVELRGPIGGYFVWDTSMGGPLLLVAGGSGIVPLMAMLRHRMATKSTVPARLLYSSRTYEDIIYRDDLDELAGDHSGLEVIHTLTREQPPGWQGFNRRIDLNMLKEVAQPLGKKLIAYVCGPTALVEGVANGLVVLGVPPVQIRTERFGPTGRT
jgi:ferredoxin-NADP reductase